LKNILGLSNEQALREIDFLLKTNCWWIETRRLCGDELLEHMATITRFRPWTFGDAQQEHRG